MLNSKPLNDLIFLDIETVPQYKSFFDMSKTMQELFLKRFKRQSEKLMGLEMDDWDVESLTLANMVPEVEKLYQTNAPLQPEFLKIVCISIGWFETKIPDDLSKLDPHTELVFKTTSFYGENERELLGKFNKTVGNVLSKSFNHSHHMVAHNGKNFDFPVIAKRMLLNGIPCPPFLDISGKKHWEINHLVDTKEEWKFGVYDANVSLALLCEVFGITSSKDDIDGSQVRDVYYEEKNVERIAIYCEKDVFKNAELYLGMKLIKNKVIHSQTIKK